MDQNAVIMLFAGIAIGGALFALGIWLYPKLKSKKQGYPFEDEIEAALLPFIFDGVAAAYRLSERGVDDIQKRMKGADKKKIADSIYRLLPDKIGKFEIAIVKKYITQESFEALVQKNFDDFNNFVDHNQKHFDDLFEKWKTDNKPA